MRLREKVLFGTLAALSITGVLLFTKNNVINAAQDTGKDNVLTLEQLTDENYTSYQGGRYVSSERLSTADQKYSLVFADGSVYKMDNSDGKYGDVSFSTGSAYYNVLYSKKADKHALINADGTFYGKTNGYYSTIAVTGNNKDGSFGGSYFYTDDSGITHFCTKDGTEKVSFDLDENVRDIRAYGDKYFFVRTNSGTVLYNADGTKEQTLANKEGFIYVYNDHCLAWYKRVDNDYTGSDVYNSTVGRVIPTYYDKDLKEISKEQYDQLWELRDDLYPVSWDKSIDASKYTLSDDFHAYGKATIDGVEVILGLKGDGKSSNYAMFTTDGKMVLGNVVNDCIFKNIITIKDGETYKLIRISKKVITNTDNNNNSDNVANSSNGSDSNEAEMVKDAQGNVSAEVVAGGTTDEKISITTTDSVVPAGSKFSVGKVVSGEKYDASKQVLQDVADKVMVYNIDLLNSADVKIQPNGKVQITVPAPTGYNSDYISVYRLSEDEKSYVKLPSYVRDGKVVFETDHFSTYIIAEDVAVANVEQATEAEDAGAASTTDSTPATMDISNGLLWIVVLGAAVLTMVYAGKKKRIIK